MPDRDFDFVPGSKGPHTRRTRIHVPDQKNRKNLTINSAALPTETVPTPPASKGIEKIIRLVIEPDVRDENNAPVFDFDPPLTVSVDFTPEDAQAARDSKGNAKLSLFTCYKDGDTWKFARLNTTVSSNTLTATVDHLHPQDPLGLGYP